MAEKSFEEQFGKPIPSWLYSEKTKQPFQRCTLCNTTLADKSYSICKSFSRLTLAHAPILSFEMAICEDCAELYSSHISKETMEAIEELSETYPKLLPGISIELTEVDNPHVPKPTCGVTNKPLEELYEYEMSAYVSNNFVLGSANVIGEEAMKLLSDCLSDESSGFLDDFFNSLIDLPPEISEILKDKKLIF